MKTFENWLKENRKDVSLPEGNISGSWFATNGLPMVVHCTGCDMTMCVVNAMVDDEGLTYCTDCAN